MREIPLDHVLCNFSPRIIGPKQEDGSASAVVVSNNQIDMVQVFRCQIPDTTKGMDMQILNINCHYSSLPLSKNVILSRRPRPSAIFFSVAMLGWLLPVSNLLILA